MIVFLNTRLNEQKRVYYVLNSIYGIGLINSIKISQKLGLTSQIFFFELNSFQLRKITKYILMNYKINLELNKFIKKNLKKYFTLNMYKGYRLQRKLPIRGQRTHTNASTIKRMKFLNLK